MGHMPKQQYMYIRARMELTAELLDTLEAVEPTVAEWDRLAVQANRPYCAPAWLLAWWRHAAPAGARLAVIVVRDGDRIVGVAPFYAVRRGPVWEYALLGTEITSRIEPLAESDRIDEVAVAVAETLAERQPAARDHHPRGPARVLAVARVPALRLARQPPSVDARAPRDRRADRRAWPPTTSTSGSGGAARTSASRCAACVASSRRTARPSGSARRPRSCERDLRDFERLHHARWDLRGGSMSLVPGADKMLEEAGLALLDERPLPAGLDRARRPA